jgi:hypothetical protein
VRFEGNVVMNLTLDQPEQPAPPPQPAEPQKTRAISSSGKPAGAK